MSVADADSASGMSGPAGGRAGLASEDGDRDVGCDVAGLCADTTANTVPLDLLVAATLVDSATAGALG